MCCARSDNFSIALFFFSVFRSQDQKKVHSENNCNKRSSKAAL